MKIAVAGAGIAGLAAAALLARQGREVTVYDQFPAPRPVGSGLMIQPVGLAVLHALGLADPLRQAASAITRILGRTAGGRTVLDVRYCDLRPGLAGFAVQRAVLFDLLLGAADRAGARLVPATCITGVDEAADGVHLCAGEDRMGPFELAIDALGAWSPLCPRPSRPLDYGALWALLDWPGTPGLEPDRLEQRYRRASHMVGILPVGRRGAGRTRLTFFWSLRGADHARWQATPIGAWKDEVRALWPATAPVLEQIRGHDDLVFARYTHHTVGRPGRGRVAHLGDSHHATSPQLGQGANMGLLDAAALAGCVDACPDPAAATAAYARQRRGHVLLYQTASRLFTPLYQSDSRILPWIRDWLAAPASRVPPAPLLLARLVAGELAGRSRQARAGGVANPPPSC